MRIGPNACPAPETFQRRFGARAIEWWPGAGEARLELPVSTGFQWYRFTMEQLECLIQHQEITLEDNQTEQIPRRLAKANRAAV